jgi:hypothetical protein
VGAQGTRQLPPRTRRGIVGEIARALDETVPDGNAAIAPVLRALSARMRVGIVSDFLGDADEMRRRAGEIAAAGGEVHAVHVVADDELDPPSRSMLAVDPEDATIARPLVAESRAAYLEQFAAWREAIASAWRGEGLSYTFATTSEPASHIVRRVAGAASGSGRAGRPREV